MSLQNEFVCTEVRFAFWNGQKNFTVHYSPGIRMWFIFDERMTDNCLAKYELGKRETPVVSHAVARLYLDRYFQEIKSEFHTVNY